MRTIAELAGDVLCVGLPASALAPETARTLAELGPGAILFFARNVSTPAATRELARAARAAVGGDLPPLVCVDQEGGRVARSRFTEPSVPSMMALGATDDEDLARRVGMRLARDCAAIGANVDFAPVLDLALVPASTVVGTRSLGDDPARVAALGSAIVRGLHDGGIASVPKHFPGHGATALDSHVALPTISTSAADLRARDLVPFRAAFAAGAPAVMTAHAIVTALDPHRPATLSPHVLTTLLREELGFTGACFTDCLQMEAIARDYGTARGAVLALVAGADCCVISHDLELARDARDAIVAAVADGTLARERLAQAAERVRHLRRTWPGESTGEAALGDGTVPCEDVAATVASRAIALAYGDVTLDLARPVTVVSFEGVSGDGVAAHAADRPSLSLALRRRRMRSESLRVPLDPGDEMASMLADLIAAQGERGIVLVARRAHVHPAQRAMLAALIARFPHAIGASVLEPFDVTALAGARGIACAFDDGDAAIDALADVLTGRARATGRAPVHLAALAP